jgi:non-specific serine/threonine protein kinase
MDLFLQLAQKNNLPLSINLNRTIPFFNQHYFFKNTLLKPNLHFKKTNEHIIYTLSLQENDLIYFPVNHLTILLLNSPGWIAIDKNIYGLAEINGNKVKPFISKKSIEIQEKNSRIYFETFIKDILKKVEIETDGFQIVQNNTLLNCFIEPEYYFIKDVYLFSIGFQYKLHQFLFSDKRQLASKIEIHNSIEVFQTKRNLKEEAVFISKAKTLGLIEYENGLFGFENLKNKGKYSHLEHFLLLNEAFKKEAFDLSNFSIDHKKLITSFATISASHQEKEDWFDINMHIHCGDFSFPFTAIVSHLKSQNPVYELEDGSLFIIPNQWFTQYKSLVTMGEKKGDLLRILSNQYPLLDVISDSKIVEKSENNTIKYDSSENLKATLRPYQKEGVQWLLDHHYNELGACLADDMGLGKTLQTIAVLTFVKEQMKTVENTEINNLFSSVEMKAPPLKALIVAPSSLIYNWKSEIKKFAPFLKVTSYVGKDRTIIKKKLVNYDVIITSYSIVLRDIVFFKTLSFNYLILDESQYIKNKTSKIFVAINELSVKHKITLSGTPIENSLDDLWSQMQFINPNLLGSFTFFKDNFKIPIEKKNDDDAIENLKKLISPFILRRTKEQVAKDLPALTEQVFYTEMEPEQFKLYEKEKSAARNFLLNLDHQKNKINVLNVLLKLRQIANHPSLIGEKNSASGKFVDVIEYIKTLLKAGQKILVFSSFVKHLELYTNWCDENKHKYSLLTGSVSAENKEKAIADFQNNEQNQLFFISLKAGGVGLNLTAANYVIILDPWWNPFAEKQAIARAHRIGQNKQVNVVRFITKDSIEEKIISLQKNKTALVDAIIEENCLPNSITENISYLLE